MSRSDCVARRFGYRRRMQASYRSGPRALALIAVFKLVKSTLLVVLALLLFRLRQPEAGARFAAWLAALPIASGHELVGRAVRELAGLDAHTMILFAVIALAYATLYLVEGYGLWRNTRWAEYLTIVATSLLVPLELWEVLVHFSATKLLALVVNLAIVAYLVHLLRSEHARAGRR